MSSARMCSGLWLKTRSVKPIRGVRRCTGMERTESGVFVIDLPRIADVGVARVRLEAFDRRLQNAIIDLAPRAPGQADALVVMRGPLASLAAEVRAGAAELCEVVVAGYQYAIAIASRALGERMQLSRWAPRPEALDALVDTASFAADERTRAALHALRMAADALESPSSRAA